MAELDRRATVALLTAPVAGVVAIQFANPETWLAIAPGFAQGIRALLWARVWQTAVLLVVYVVLPFGLARLVGVRELGLGLGGSRGYLRIWPLSLAVALPLVVALSFTTAFRHGYPVFAPAIVGGRVLGAWLPLFATQLFAVEFFYRGFLLALLSPALGRYALYVMLAPYALTHRDPVEAIGAVVVGLLLGELRLRSRSIWVGWLVHTSIAFFIEAVAIWQAHRH